MKKDYSTFWWITGIMIFSMLIGIASFGETIIAQLLAGIYVEVRSNH